MVELVQWYKYCSLLESHKGSNLIPQYLIVSVTGIRFGPICRKKHCERSCIKWCIIEDFQCFSTMEYYKKKIGGLNRRYQLWRTTFLSVAWHMGYLCFFIVLTWNCWLHEATMCLVSTFELKTLLCLVQFCLLFLNL
jgi:hypothetical protein